MLDWVSWHLVSFWGEPTRCKRLPPSQPVQQRAHAKTGNKFNAKVKILVKLPLVGAYLNMNIMNTAGSLVSTTKSSQNPNFCNNNLAQFFSGKNMKDKISKCPIPARTTIFFYSSKDDHSLTWAKNMMTKWNMKNLNFWFPARTTIPWQRQHLPPRPNSFGFTFAFTKIPIAHLSIGKPGFLATLVALHFPPVSE